MLQDYSKFVLHEVVESMANLNCENTFKLLERFRDEKDEILYESCYLAKRLIEWKKDTENGKTEGLDLTKLKTESQNPSPPYNYLQEVKYSDIAFL